MVNTNSVLSFIPFKQTIDWNIKQFFNSTSIHSSFEMKKIGKAIIRQKEQVVVENDKRYKRITIKTNCGGVVVRDEVLGKEIKTKNQYYVRAGQLAVSKIDARNGAFGIVPPDADGAIITGNFWVYDVNPEIANIEYLVLLLSSNVFVQAWLDCSNGSGNRLYLQEEKFLNYKVPLPNISEQIKLIERYDATMNEVAQKEKIAIDTIQNMQKFFMNKLNLKDVNTAKNTNILNFVPYKKITNKWQWDELSEAIEISLKDCAYPIKTLGEELAFVNRSWQKKKYTQNSFMYIELGGINSVDNTANANSVKTIEAPSRATQTVKIGDLIIGTTRPYLKRFALIRKQEDGYVCSSGFQVVEKSVKYDSRYVLEVLKLNPIIKQFESLMTGALYPAVNFEQLKQVRIPFPPISVQQHIADYIEQEKSKSKEFYKQADILRDCAKKDFEEAVFGEA